MDGGAFRRGPFKSDAVKIRTRGNREGDPRCPARGRHERYTSSISGRRSKRSETGGLSRVFRRVPWDARRLHLVDCSTPSRPGDELTSRETSDPPSTPTHSNDRLEEKVAGDSGFAFETHRNDCESERKERGRV